MAWKLFWGTLPSHSKQSAWMIRDLPMDWDSKLKARSCMTASYPGNPTYGNQLSETGCQNPASLQGSEDFLCQRPESSSDLGLSRMGASATWSCPANTVSVLTLAVLVLP